MDASKPLEDWMKQNKLYDQWLYDGLVSSSVTSVDALQKLSDSQFDGVLRQIRLDRVSVLKEKSARNRADKLLVSLERAYRKLAASSTTAAATADAAVDAKDDKEEELMPWYLSGKQKTKKNPALSSKERTFHQKKKDNKVADKLRESGKVEQEWIETYSRAKYGGYIAPPQTKAYGKKKKTKTEEKEPAAAVAASSSPIPDLHQVSVDFEEIVVDVCLEMLLTHDECWEGRIQMMEVLVKQLCAPECTDDVYALKLCKFLCSIGHQFSDPRSLIIQAMEQSVSKLVDQTPTRFILFAPYVLSAVFNTFPVRIEALRDPGLKLGDFMVDRLKDYDTQRDVLRCVLQGLDSKHVAIRTECAKYLDVLMQKIAVLESDEEQGQDADQVALLADLESAVQKACKDAGSEARVNGYRALKRFQGIAPKTAEKIMSKMTKAQMDKYNEANKQ
eukprot:CAMPEP_0202688866 /NCGR_PEP_ID=MMETSP1385-20130828/4261_1 /ASSEMBLY_ACC=CAM_ASM_000861 /TAXON_ID=933848 /ORGANISM="Elphidium margaritaceum" /LENGTH=446 /DNA_ID=CAMNT_0049343917 /DNA_START=78 /DNA_END=1418 /DNA_ORIENTATION=+